MLPDKKGIYPNWVSDGDVIDQVLKEVIVESGRLPFSYVVNPTHDIITQERMKGILERMRKEKLILPIGEDNFIEMNIEGSKAAHIGYRKYKRIKGWNVLRHRIDRLSFIFFVLFILVFLGLILYFILHYFKVV